MEAKIERHLEEYVENSALRLKAEKLVIDCGIPAKLKGFDFIVDAVMLFGKVKLRGYQCIYGSIARLHGISSKDVNRDIGYALKKSYDLHIRLSELVGLNFPQSEIHSSLVIGYLARLLMQ